MKQKHFLQNRRKPNPDTLTIERLRAELNSEWIPFMESDVHVEYPLFMRILGEFSENPVMITLHGYTTEHAVPKIAVRIPELREDGLVVLERCSLVAVFPTLSRLVERVSVGRYPDGWMFHHHDILRHGEEISCRIRRTVSFVFEDPPGVEQVRTFTWSDQDESR